MSVAVEEMLPKGCTFDPGDWAILATHWYPVALSRDVTTEPVSAQLLDESLRRLPSGRRGGHRNDVCPHRGLPLSLGRGNGAGITCAYHGLQFGEGGVCRHVPAHPDSKIPQRLRLVTYPAVERYGLIWTCLRPSAEASPRPRRTPPSRRCRSTVSPAFSRSPARASTSQAFSGRQLEGFIDVAHFGFVHKDSFGDPENTTVPEYTPVPTGTDFRRLLEHRRQLSTRREGRRAGLALAAAFRCLLAFTATLVVHFPGDARLVIMNAASPSRPDDPDVCPGEPKFRHRPANPGRLRLQPAIFEEDRRIVEAQKPENLPSNTGSTRCRQNIYVLLGRFSGFWASTIPTVLFEDAQVEVVQGPGPVGRCRSSRRLTGANMRVIRAETGEAAFMMNEPSLARKCTTRVAVKGKMHVEPPKPEKVRLADLPAVGIVADRTPVVHGESVSRAAPGCSWGRRCCQGRRRCPWCTNPKWATSMNPSS